MNEFISAFRKLGLCRMLRKFSSPTQCDSMLPTFTSVKA